MDQPDHRFVDWLWIGAQAGLGGSQNAGDYSGFSFIFIGGAVLNQWVWRRRLLREQAQEEPGTGYTRALR